MSFLVDCWRRWDTKTKITQVFLVLLILGLLIGCMYLILTGKLLTSSLWSPTMLEKYPISGYMI